MMLTRREVSASLLSLRTLILNQPMSNQPESYFVTARSAVSLPFRLQGQRLALPGDEIPAELFKGHEGALQNLIREGCLKPFRTVPETKDGVDRVRATDLPPLPSETAADKISGRGRSTGHVDHKLDEIQRRQAEEKAKAEKEEAAPKTDWKARKAMKRKMEVLANSGQELSLEDAKALGLVK